MISSLSNLSPSDAIDCLNKLDRASKTSEIRNPAAYLAGVVKRLSTSHGGGGGGGGGFRDGGGRRDLGASPSALAPAAQRELEALYASGRVRPEDLNERTLQALGREQPPEVQALVLRSFGDRNLNGIRNMAGQQCSWCSLVAHLMRVVGAGGVRRLGSAAQ